MRIAIAGNFGLTGKQTMAVRALPLAEALVARGHAVLMALPVRRSSDEGGVGEICGVRLRYAGRGPRLPGLTEIWQVALLARLCWRWQPDVLYCFKPIAHSGALLWLFWLARRLGLFRGMLLLDSDDWEGEGGWNDRQPFPGWLKRLIAWQEQWSLRHADAVTLASRALLKVAAQVGVRDPIYLPNSLSVPSSPLTASTVPTDLRQRLGLGDRPVVLLYTRFVEFSLQRLLDTFQAILCRAADAVLLVVGQGLEGEEVELARMASAHGLGERVVMVGWTEPDQLSAYFQVADVALYLLDDNLLNQTKCPMKLLELLAAGVAVVADRVGQAAEYLEDGRTGILVSPGNPEEMSDAAVLLFAEPQRRRAMGEAARGAARARWSWDLWAEEVNRAINRHQARPPGPGTF